jgi:hypothetical protein
MGTQGHGSRTNRTLAVAALVVLSAALPAAAYAGNPLLSGYGGPGQGSQAILGSALLNGPGSSGGGPSGSSGTGAPSLEARSARGGNLAGSHAVKGRPGRQAPGAAREPLTGSSGTYPAFERSAATRPSGLGLSGEDLLYILLVLAALACTALLTRRLTQAAKWGST